MLTDKWTDLKPHPVQSALWRCKTRFAAVVAGRGSGKTELARRRTVRYLAVRKPWPNPLYFYAMPTRDQAKRVAWQHIKDLVPKHWARKEDISETELSIKTIFGSKLYVVGMDKPQRIEGEQWDGGVIDESSDQRPKAFDLSVLPALSHRNAWCWRIGVPKRFGIGAQEFKEFYDAAKTDPDITAFWWKSSDILDPNQLRFARERLDSRDFKEQYEASWESSTGRIYYSFDESVNVKRNVNYNPNLPIVIGCDFNVDPMSWVIGHIIGNELYVFDELFERNINTPQGLDILFNRYGNHNNGFMFYGDASGRAKSTSAFFSDYAHIHNDERFFPKELLFPLANPGVVDRLSSTNALMKNAAGEARCFISYKCRHLINDLVNRSYKPGSRQPDDYGDIGHISDALGYIIHYVWPPEIHLTRTPGKVFIGNG